jgi:hypothetical protein
MQRYLTSLLNSSTYVDRSLSIKLGVPLELTNSKCLWVTAIYCMKCTMKDGTLVELAWHHQKIRHPQPAPEKIDFFIFFILHFFMYII